jgi:hypothetical protein
MPIFCSDENPDVVSSLDAVKAQGQKPAMLKTVPAEIWKMAASPELLNSNCGAHASYVPMIITQISLLPAQSNNCSACGAGTWMHPCD